MNYDKLVSIQREQLLHVEELSPNATYDLLCFAPR